VRPGAPDPLWVSDHWDGWDTYAGGVPVPAPLDPEAAAALAERLARARDEVRTASGELLEHFLDIGDGSTQLAVETLADHAADALRALDDALRDSSRALLALSDEPVPQGLPGTSPPRGRGPAW
jgi:hypothetical protein